MAWMVVGSILLIDEELVLWLHATPAKRVEAMAKAKARRRVAADNDRLFCMSDSLKFSKCKDTNIFRIFANYFAAMSFELTN